MRIPWKIPHGMGWDGTAPIAFSMGPTGQQYITDLPPSETVIKQEIKNLLNEHSD